MQGVGSFQPPRTVGDAQNQSNPDEDPPFSRLFVTCPPQYTKEFIEQQFSTYGKLQSVKMITDKATRDFKGLCFVKFERASHAALAKESLDGAPLEFQGGAFKVAFAVPRGAPMNTTDDGELPPRSRLFVTYLKTTPEEVVTQRFAQFGDLEYVKCLSSRSGEGRGIAYVKYSKTSTALRAMEEINEQENDSPTTGQPFRVRIAVPANPAGAGPTVRPPQPPQMHMHMHMPMHPMQQLQHMNNMFAHVHAHAHHHQVQQIPQPGMQMNSKMWKNSQIVNRIDNNIPPGSRVWFSLAKKLQVEYLQHLFGRYGFLESIYLMKGA
uniref:RRM domain-containing protein n=1 Tax=Eutreptiella gymnastica TaxID=73025 RepID=A0A7S1ISR6_9EUGL|mmetsp:Transcript_39266/g.70437  ORF Transcript_39266/g.70437 Transcript_39266/m.70437 type:complete len:323 (+) Transcript_39266:147-1115(+)